MTNHSAILLAETTLQFHIANTFDRVNGDIRHGADLVDIVSTEAEIRCLANKKVRWVCNPEVVVKFGIPGDDERKTNDQTVGRADAILTCVTVLAVKIEERS